MRIVVMTGPSGAGKTHALHSLEDAGYYTVDNLPPGLLPALAAFCQAQGRERIAVVMDVRVGAALDELSEILDTMRRCGMAVEVLFLDASETALIQRFKETRRPHPLLPAPMNGIVMDGIAEAIERERDLLAATRTLADSVLDTSLLTTTQLRDVLHTTYAPETRPGLLVTIISFGFKHGLPIDADLVFDVRFLSNPHYVPALKYQDGRSSEVAAFVHADALTRPFFDRMTDLVLFALPQYQEEGKAYLNIAIGCTGGKHRSVVLSEDLAGVLQRDGYNVVLRHRDVGQTNPSVLSHGEGRDGKQSDAIDSAERPDADESSPMTAPNRVAGSARTSEARA